MAREFYSGDLVQVGGGSAAPAPNLPFTVWTDYYAGTNVTSQLLDGASGSIAYVATTDANGNLRPFRGPDGYEGSLFADTGIAGVRYLLVSPSLIDKLVAYKNAGGGTGGAVSSVAGRTGAVTLTSQDVGLGNVDNTADAQKPVSTAQATAIGQRALDSAVVHLTGAETVNGIKTFTSSPTVPDPTSPTDVANRRFVLANAGTGGGSGSTATLPVYVIPASDLTAYPTAGTGAQKMAAINANDARIVHEMVTRPGYHVQTDPSQWWPFSGVIDEFVGTYTTPTGTTGNLVEGADYSLGGKFLLCRGTRASSTDTSSNVVQSGPVLSIIRKSANSGLVVTPTNLRNNFQLGGTPNLGSYFTAVCSAFDATTNLNLYVAGGLLDLVSQNDYGYSQRAGYGDGTAGTGVYKGAFFPVAGLCINVTGYSLTAMNTAIGSGTVTTLERRTIVGATSGVTAIVQGGDFGANGQLLVNSVSGNWSAGETIKDQATNATVATYSSTSVCMAGALNVAYDNTPQIRFVTRSTVDVGRMVIKPDGEIDDVIENYNRPDVMGLTGCTGVNLDGIRVLGGYSAGLTLRSCWDVTGLIHVRDLPNHAFESLTERAYGYAIRWLGHSQNFYVGLDVQRVRHGTTSNAIRGTWNLNARTGSATGATSLCTNFWNHGPGQRLGTMYGRVENTWSACWDFHEGAENVTLVNPQAIQPVGSGRATTSPDGFSIRGFGINVIGAYSKGCRVGIYDLAGPLDSSGLAYTNSYTGGVHELCQAGGVFQSEDVFDETLARFDIRGNVFRCDPNAKTAYAQQFGLLLRRGNTTVTGNKFSSIGYAMLRLTSFVGSGGSTAPVSSVLIRDNEFDWTDSTASRLISLEATYDLTDWANHARVNPVAGTQRPANWIVNSGGSSAIRWGARSASFLSSTRTVPSDTTNTTSGTPTTVNIDPAGTGTSTPTHNTSAAVTVTPGTGAGSGATATMTAGSTDVSGEVQVAVPASGASANTVFATVTYGTAFATDVFPVIAAGSNAQTRAVGVLSHSATGFTITMGNTPVASQTAKITYYVPGV